MSRAPRRHDRTDGRARRLHLEVIQPVRQSYLEASGPVGRLQWKDLIEQRNIAE